jgi:hypothetical protein
MSVMITLPPLTSIILIVVTIFVGTIGFLLLIVRRNEHPIKERSCALFLSQICLIILTTALAAQGIAANLGCFYDIIVVNGIAILVLTSYGFVLNAISF